MKGGLELQPGRWYACEFIGEEFPPESDSTSYSPILVHGAKGLKTGRRQFELHFHHANYPAGVQDKLYRLRTLLRAPGLLLAESLEHQPVRLLQIYEISLEWLGRHFPGLARPDRPEELQAWLSRRD